MAASPVGQYDLPGQLLDAALRGDQDTYWRLLRLWLAGLPWTGLLLSTLACGVVGAWLGWRRGRAWAGLAWGLLLGPLGWPLAAGRRRSRPPRPPR